MMFDYTAALHEVIRDIAEVCPPFSHIQPERILVTIAQCRKAGVHGIYASVLPMRFEGGKCSIVRKGIRLTRQPLFHGEYEILYIITFYLPRFCNLTFDQKMKTIFHELFHISPEFNGDVRRFAGRKYAHGSSRRSYDKQIEKYVHDYLRIRGAGAKVLEFLHLDFETLVKTRGTIVGRRIRRNVDRYGIATVDC